MNKGTGKPLSLYQVLCAFSNMGRKIKVPSDNSKKLKDWPETNHLDHLHTHKDGKIFQYNISNHTEIPKDCLKDKVNAIDFSLVRSIFYILIMIVATTWALVSPGISFFVWFFCIVFIAFFVVIDS